MEQSLLIPKSWGVIASCLIDYNKLMDIIAHTKFECENSLKKTTIKRSPKVDGFISSLCTSFIKMAVSQNSYPVQINLLNPDMTKE